MLGAPQDQFRGIEGAARSWNNVSLDFVLTQIRGHCNNRTVQDVGMTLDYIFNFLGRDVFTPPPDHILFAVNEVEKAVFVQPAQVSGV
jgi:hypothetical protein